MNRKLFTGQILIVIFSITLIWYYISSENSFMIVMKVSSDIKFNKMQNKAKRILFYTKQFGFEQWWENNETQYGIERCDVSKCIITNNKTDFNRSDLVLFHGRDLPKDRNELKALRNDPSSKWNHIWMWVFQESPENFDRHNRYGYDNLFNWTATYRAESEVTLNYARVEILTEYDARPKLGENFAKNKDKMITILLSNCVPARLRLLSKMNDYVQVDVYGVCAKRFNPNVRHNTCFRNTFQCDELQKRYKFYFSIENSYCKDYVTEKFYKNALQRGLVPIVVSGADFSDPFVAPPNSYISLLDFKDLKSLGYYLSYLDKNDTAYSEYHLWRYSYKIVNFQEICEICKRLWEYADDNVKERTAAVTTDGHRSTGSMVSEYWDTDGQCKDLYEVLNNYL